MRVWKREMAERVIDNEEWVARLTGDESVRNQAVEELSQILVRGLSRSLATRYGGGLQAEDIAQEALIKILDSLDSFEGRSKFTTWAMTIATRLGISELRRKRYGDVSLEGLGADGETSFDLTDSDQQEAEDDLKKQELLALLKHLIETDLTQKQRLAIRAYLDGIPIEEIARRMDSNRNAIYKLVHDARLRLKTGFEKSGMSAEDVIKVLA